MDDIGKIISFVLILLFYILPAIRGNKKKAKQRQIENERRAKEAREEYIPESKESTSEVEIEKKLRELFDPSYEEERREEVEVNFEPEVKKEEENKYAHFNSKFNSEDLNNISKSKRIFNAEEIKKTELKLQEIRDAEDNSFWDDFGDFDAKKMVIYSEIFNRPKW